ncbi:L-fuculose-phosphate aldolase [Nitrosomonas sp. Nm51]|uniref:class II aldolase/adducin family protein n=1 Tax=Nitrosomonas sp. Nm51 TaxID=133720 RepID=UPI0008D6CD60|nr:class II aldolase/adducin family protein [Nitrosomonas sp. Nm51]SER06445.1 L-fuculose-phosphate aldolase [Nitrosomonas sp. Nm51]
MKDNTEIKQYYPICEEIITAARRLHQKNMLAAADGNISCRVTGNKVLITPSGVSKAFMTPEEMALVSLDNKTLQGKPSSEKIMHLEVYRLCPEAKAVVHAHPPTAIAWTVARPELAFLPSHAVSEVILACGDIPFVPYARPGTQAMGDNLKQFLPQHRALILSRHGALTWGESLDEAWMGMERIEHSSEILWKAHVLGGLTFLPDEEVLALKAIRQRIGDRLL